MIDDEEVQRQMERARERTERFWDTVDVELADLQWAKTVKFEGAWYRVKSISPAGVVVKDTLTIPLSKIEAYRE